MCSRRKLLEKAHSGKLLAFFHDHLLLKQKRFFTCTHSQGKVWKEVSISKHLLKTEGEEDNQNKHWIWSSPFSDHWLKNLSCFCNLSICSVIFCLSSLPYACMGLSVNCGILTYKMCLNWMWINLIYKNRLSGITVKLFCYFWFWLYITAVV